MSSGEPPKEGRRRNSRQPEHEQERRGAAPEVRLFNDVAVALVVCLASRSLTDESRFSALPFQEPGAAAEVEALQLRGRDVTVAHGDYCVGWRVCPAEGTRDTARVDRSGTKQKAQGSTMSR